MDWTHAARLGFITKGFVVKLVVWPVLIMSIGLSRVAIAEDAATGPSFDCGQATSTLDRSICNDAELAGLDRDLASKYAAALKAGDENGQTLVREAQLQWAHGRAERCGLPTDGEAGSDAVACLKQLYQARIADLAALEPAANDDPVAWLEGLWQVDSLIGVADATINESAAKAFVGRLVRLQRSAVSGLSGDSCASPDFRVLAGDVAVARIEVGCLGNILVELSWTVGTAAQTVTWTERGASFSLKRVATETQLRMSKGIGQGPAGDAAGQDEPAE